MTEVIGSELHCVIVLHTAWVQQLNTCLCNNVIYQYNTEVFNAKKLRECHLYVYCTLMCSMSGQFFWVMTRYSAPCGSGEL